MLEERSVARCAERLFVSPSAVSHALAKLRQMFSDPLFVRTGGGMLPTARAQSLERSLSLLKAVLDVELEAGRVSAPGATFEPGESVRDIRIVSPGALEISLLPVLAAILRSRAPHWSLTIEPFERRSYEVDLATGRVDFVLSVGGATPIGALVDAAVVWEMGSKHNSRRRSQTWRRRRRNGPQDQKRSGLGRFCREHSPCSRPHGYSPGRHGRARSQSTP